MQIEKILQNIKIINLDPPLIPVIIHEPLNCIMHLVSWNMFSWALNAMEMAIKANLVCTMTGKKDVLHSIRLLALDMLNQFINLNFLHYQKFKWINLRVKHIKYTKQIKIPQKSIIYFIISYYLSIAKYYFWTMNTIIQWYLEKDFNPNDLMRAVTRCH